MRVSFVVPTRNSARTLGSCLSSLRAQTHPDIEVVVVDNSSTDDTPEIAARYADVVATAGPERSSQRNHGTRLSGGEVVVFVDSDMVLEPTVAAEVSAVFVAQPDLGALVIPERSFGTGFLTRCRVMEKNLYVGDDRVESPRAFRRRVIDDLGGWAEGLVAAEDWDLADRTRQAGVRVGRVRSWIWHDEGRLRLATTFQKKRYYGRWIDLYLSLHQDGRRHFARTALLRQPGRLLRHPLLTGGLIVLKATEAAGLYLGIRDSRQRSVSPSRPARPGTA